MFRLARACQILLRLGGLEAESMWTDHGPTKRASWLKGYIRRQPPRVDRISSSGRGSISASAAMSHRDKALLIAAFDFWNGSGGVLLADVLHMKPRLVMAIGGFMEAHCSDGPELLDAWIARWSDGASPENRS